MESAPTAPRFLEPIYLNESMVLNCAAYLFQGVTLENEEVTSNSQKRGLFARAGVPFLSDVIGLSFGTAKETGFEARANRRFTVGGLHMNVLDRLYPEKMILDISKISDEVLQQSAILDKYVHAHVILRATDYWSTLQALKMSGPLLNQLVQDYEDEIISKVYESAHPNEKRRLDLVKYLDSLEAIVGQLLDDYLSSGQLEMVMWLDMQTPLGILDLPIEEYDPQKIKSALTGGKYHVYGKITARAFTNQKLSMLQRTSLFEIHDLFSRVVSAINELEDADTQETDGGVKRAQETLARVLVPVQKLLKTEMHGPTLRMIGMSVCV